jgi:hypothetical protein
MDLEYQKYYIPIVIRNLGWLVKMITPKVVTLEK